MSILHDKQILLGISGSIAAYKTPTIARLLVKAGAKVQVVMTEAAKGFVTPLTLSTLTDREVLTSFTQEDNDNDVWNNHVSLGIWADLMLIAPASANTIAKMATAAADNLLMATYLSAKCPVFFAPAMDLDMYKHPSTITSLDKLQSFGNKMIPATRGELASGLVGQGRLAEPKDIVSFMENDILSSMPLHGKKVLITAGPTHESIDPVRFIGNHSSGKMGFEIAKAAANLGAKVFLVSGPSKEEVCHASIHRIDVVSAEDMYTACHQYFPEVSIAILSAAVADYRPKKAATEKIKKKNSTLDIILEPTKDILASLGVIKNEQFLVGFALETTNELVNALTKLKQKNLDAIVLNSLNDEGAGFSGNTNKVTFIDKEEHHIPFEMKSKSDVAIDIMNEILKKIDA